MSREKRNRSASATTTTRLISSPFPPLSLLGRSTPEDAGLWQDSQIAPLKRIVDFAHTQGEFGEPDLSTLFSVDASLFLADFSLVRLRSIAVDRSGTLIGIQLQHAGRKSSGVSMFAQNTGEGPGSHVAHKGVQGGWDESELAQVNPSFLFFSELIIFFIPLVKSTLRVRSLRRKELLFPRKRRRSTWLESFERSSTLLDERRKLDSTSSIFTALMVSFSSSLSLSPASFFPPARLSRPSHPLSTSPSADPILLTFAFLFFARRIPPPLFRLPSQQRPNRPIRRLLRESNPSHSRGYPSRPRGLERTALLSSLRNRLGCRT